LPAGVNRLLPRFFILPSPLAFAREQTHFGRTLDDVIIGNQITIVRDETPVGGQPLKYRQTADDNFLLYSVGWNGADDGGQLSLFPYTDGDWVWQ
jgi:hypothetical protein